MNTIFSVFYQMLAALDAHLAQKGGKREKMKKKSKKKEVGCCKTSF